MPIRLIWKGMMFTFSIFMLLLVMGYGKGNYSQSKNWAIFSGQAKVARQGARTSGFKSVAPAPKPEKTIWDTIRDTTDEWMGGGNMNSAGKSAANRSELQNLQRRAAGRGTATTMAVQKMSR